MPSLPPIRSAPITEARYDIFVDSATVSKQSIDVTMTFRVQSTDPIVLTLPAWSPGHYKLLWFARRVSRFTAEADGQPLEWNKLDYQTWQIFPQGKSQVHISFRYLADSMDRAGAGTYSNFAFFNGTNLFLYPVGRGFNWSATVTVHTEQGWHVATGMDQTTAPNTYQAHSYHDLVDMPFFVGRFSMDSTRIADRWVRLATYPAASMTDARRKKIFGWAARFAPAQIAVFRDIPFRNYTIFLLADSTATGGGLEHQNSQVIQLHPKWLDFDNSPLYAHEFFHLWNVKRLRPADMLPYQYAESQPTVLLWVSEGITEYYSNISLVRGGLTDSTTFLRAIGEQIGYITTRAPVALSDASLSTWIEPTDGTKSSFIVKGALAGLLLDILIRDASNNKKSLDDVLRDLYNANYKRGKGFTVNQWWTAVQHAADGKSFGEFRRSYVDGRAPLPVDSVLQLAGLHVVYDSASSQRSSQSPTIRVVPILYPPERAIRIRSGILHGTTTE